MKLSKFAAVMAVVVLAAIMLPLTVWAASNVVDDTPSPAEDVVSPNLLTNPGMDGKFVKQCSQRGGAYWVAVPCNESDFNPATTQLWETVQVPLGWSAWWREPNNNLADPNYFNTYPNLCPDWKRTPPDCLPWHNPEYRDTAGGPQDYGPERKMAGDNSQKYFTFYSLHEAGMYQVIGGVKPGDRLRFSIWMEAWSTGTNDPYHSDFNQNMNLQVGIDPTGGNNPWSPNILWTKPAESFDKFAQFVVEAVAQNSIVSVWTKSRPKYALQHDDVYVDEASLTVVKPSTTTPVSGRIYTMMKIITTTRSMRSDDGIRYTVFVTRSVVVTSTRSFGSIPVTTTRPITVSASTPVTSTQLISTTVPSGDIPATYTVVRGDTLIAIARRFNIRPWMRLVELNNLQPPYKIEVGQVLILQ